MTPITPDQFEALLNTAQYNGRVHVLDMVVEVPAGARASQPAAHLVAWNNHTAESIRLEIIGGWPVVGIRVRERAGDDVVFGFGLADRNGRRFAEPGQTCGRCERPFAANEVISAYDCCLDDDTCVMTARAMAEARTAQRARLANRQDMLARQQARRDGLGAQQWMLAAAANGRQAIPADKWQRAHGDAATLEAVKAAAIANVRRTFEEAGI